MLTEANLPDVLFSAVEPPNRQAQRLAKQHPPVAIRER